MIALKVLKSFATGPLLLLQLAVIMAVSTKHPDDLELVMKRDAQIRTDERVATLLVYLEPHGLSSAATYAVHASIQQNIPGAGGQEGLQPHFEVTHNFSKDEVFRSGWGVLRVRMPFVLSRGAYVLRVRILDTFPDLEAEERLLAVRSNQAYCCPPPHHGTMHPDDVQLVMNRVQAEDEQIESQSEIESVALSNAESQNSGSAIKSNFPANPRREEGESCSNLYQFILGGWVANAGWEIASACPDLHCMPRDWGAGNMGGRSSEIWLNRAAGVVLKRLVHFRETFEREVFWLRYWEEAEEDIAPRLLAYFMGSPHDSPLLLMTDVGEMLVPGNAPLDWERQVLQLARWVGGTSICLQPVACLILIICGICIGHGLSLD